MLKASIYTLYAFMSMYLKCAASSCSMTLSACRTRIMSRSPMALICPPPPAPLRFRRVGSSSCTQSVGEKGGGGVTYQWGFRS